MTARKPKRLWPRLTAIAFGVAVLTFAAGFLYLDERQNAVAAGVQPAPEITVSIPKFKRGINLSRLQSFAFRDPARPGKYLWPPFQGELSKVSDAELDRLKALGFDFIRFPIDAGVFLAATDSERRILLDDMKSITVRLLDSGFTVMVDLHPATYLTEWAPVDILKDAPGPRFQAYADLLEDVAKRIRDLPTDKVALELMNEPQGVCFREDGQDWSVSQKQLYDRVRSVAPDLPIVLTPGCWRSLEGLEYMSMDGYDDKIIIDFHFYEPFLFTHQSLPWVLDPLRYIAGLSYPWTAGNVEIAAERTRQHIAALKAADVDVPDYAFDKAMDVVRDYYKRQKPDRAFIESRFDTISQWADKYGIAPDQIVLGEFSAIRPPKGLRDDGSRLAWIRDVRTVVEEHGYGWALWDYYEGFGLMTDNVKRTVEPGMVDALGLNAEAL
ncbi:glycoside hydrolase family 5 protein [Stappia sp. BW2]|uniref:glycoside hydrolase family 5 protein n=1 Tax=Stappia sp. BW2 TaxID=2592622 RepID=UPI0011DE6655|nr:cellulase family glycosylhydrolase [Stappia sp. BW2]TYC67369.1 glycoside hydrolase family 5 protein [Stappia sp. BW2]